MEELNTFLESLDSDATSPVEAPEVQSEEGNKVEKSDTKRLERSENTIEKVHKELAVKERTNGSKGDIEDEEVDQIGRHHFHYPSYKAYFPASRHLYVSGLPPDITPEELSFRFRRFGHIENLFLPPHHKNIAFVNYLAIRNATRAKDQLDGTHIRGHPITIKFAKGVPTRSLWVGSVSPSATDRQFLDLFQRIGSIDQWDRKVSTNCALVTYYSIEDAKSAFDSLQGHMLCGWPLKIGYSSTKQFDSFDHNFASNSAPPPHYNDGNVTRHLFVGSLVPGISEGDLWKIFSPFGSIDAVKVFEGKGYGFVDFRDESSANTARKSLDGTNLGGVSIVVKFSQGKICNTLRIDNVGSRLSEQDLMNECSNYGMVKSVVLQRERRAAWVTMVHDEDAVAVFQKLNDATIKGYDLEVHYDKRLPDTTMANGMPNSGLFLSFPKNFNIPSEGVLMDVFSEFNPRDARCFRTEMPYAFVNFFTVHDATRALKVMQGRILNEPRIILRYANRASDKNSPFFDDRIGDEMHDPSGYHSQIERREHLDDKKRKQELEIQLESKKPKKEEKIHGDAVSLLGDQRERKSTKAEITQETPAFPPSSPVSPPRTEVEKIWSGALARSGVVVCQLHGYYLGGPEYNDSHDNGLPSVLNIKSRTDLTSLSSYIPMGSSTILYFEPAQTVDKNAFNEFYNYLKEKNRAGIAETDTCTIYFIPQEDTQDFKMNLKRILLGVLVKKIAQKGSIGTILSQIINKNGRAN